MTLRPPRRGSGFAPYVAIAGLGAVVTSSLAVLVVTTTPRLTRLPAVTAGPLFHLPGGGPVIPVPPAAPAVPPAPVGVAIAAPPAVHVAAPPGRTLGRPARPHPGRYPPRPAVSPLPVAGAGPAPAPRFMRGDAPAGRYPALVSVTISDLPYLPDHRADPVYRYSRGRHCRRR
ncbi:MAG: hypothetical protein ACJ73S_17055 [Mycobacteriales bacterium]